jgi:hypothetical protein
VRRGIGLALLSAALLPAFQGGAAAAGAPAYEEAPGPIYSPAEEAGPKGIRFNGLRLNRSNGSAVLYVRVPGPGRVHLNGRGFRRLARTARRAKRVPLPIRPKIPLRRFLKQHGKARIRVDVSFEPTGGEPRTLERVVVLRRRRVG